MTTKNLGISTPWFSCNKNVLPLESCIKTTTLKVGMGFQRYMIVPRNTRVHCKTRILDHYHFGAFHLDVIYQFVNKEQRDLEVSNLQPLSQKCESSDVGHLQD